MIEPHDIPMDAIITEVGIHEKAYRQGMNARALGDMQGGHGRTLSHLGHGGGAILRLGPVAGGLLAAKSLM